MMRWSWRKWVLLAVGIVTLLVIGVAYAGFRFLAAACGNDQVEEFPSPDGARKAVMYRRDCGATTDFSRQICILPRTRSLPNWPRPVFASDGDMVVVPKWSDPLHLTVVYGPGSHDDGAKAVRLIESSGPVKITYRYVP